jgi:hypothetical protein
MSVLVDIPVRYASTRYPRKPLVKLRGAGGEAKSRIRRSWDAAMSVQGVDRVVVATDDNRIRHACEAFGAEVVMTSGDCENGTERCAEAFATFGGGFDVVVNLQGDAPSNLAVIGRYILSPKIMQNLNRIEKGVGGEIQLTDAIAKEMEEGRDVFGYCFEGKRYDCGSKVGYLQAMVAFALEREDLRDEFGAFLDEIVALRNAPE